MKTLKYEEVYRKEYHDLADARASIDASSKKSTTANVFTRRWAIVRRSSLNVRCRFLPLLVNHRWLDEK